MRTPLLSRENELPDSRTLKAATLARIARLKSEYENERRRVVGEYTRDINLSLRVARVERQLHALALCKAALETVNPENLNALQETLVKAYHPTEGIQHPIGVMQGLSSAFFPKGGHSLPRGSIPAINMVEETIRVMKQLGLEHESQSTFSAGYHAA